MNKPPYGNITRYQFGETIGEALTFFHEHTSELTGLDRALINEVVAYPVRVNKDSDSIKERQVVIITRSRGEDIPSDIYLEQQLNMGANPQVGPWKVVRAKGWMWGAAGAWMPTTVQPKQTDQSGSQQRADYPSTVVCYDTRLR